MTASMRLAIFDLDGVIVDTARYHYLAWKQLANAYGFDLTAADNERLKGVSRARSLEIVLQIGGIEADSVAREVMAEQKNQWYVERIRAMTPRELLPGAAEYVRYVRTRGVKTALGSASQNTPLIIDRLAIGPLFDIVVDGSMVRRTKPDPEVFQLAASALAIAPSDAVVFEDAEAGIEAARRAGMLAVGIGSPAILRHANAVVSGLDQLLALSAIEI